MSLLITFMAIHSLWKTQVGCDSDVFWMVRSHRHAAVSETVWYGGFPRHKLHLLRLQCSHFVCTSRLSARLLINIDVYSLIYSITYSTTGRAFSALILLVGWKEGRASGLWKTEWWWSWHGICLEWVADLCMAQLMPLPPTAPSFSKI